MSDRTAEHRKGRPAKLRARHVLLSQDEIEFFKEQSRDKLPSVPLCTEDGETPWRRHIWARETRAGIAKHNEHAKGKQRISTDASAYSFRHARISELLQIYGVDPITVAAQTATSVAMIEKGLSAIHSVGNAGETCSAERVGTSRLHT
jgi:hypothetical protein